MAVGQGELFAGLGYMAIGREATLGTGVTATAALDFMSTSLKTAKERKVLETVQRSRTYTEHIGMGKVIEGDIEFYYSANRHAPNYILQQAMGGTITSATATGETAGGLAFTHDIRIGDMDNAYKGLTLNVRRGDTTGGKVFEYHGCRINELTVSTELDDALKMAASVIGMDSTVGATDQSSNLTIAAQDPLTFDNGRLSVETTFAALTSTSFWHVQGFNLAIGNNLKGDAESRRIGTDILDVLPAGMAALTLNMSIRYDTTTARDYLLAGTELAGEMEFTGNTLAGSIIKEGLKFQMPKIVISEASEPEIGGPDEVLKQEIVCHVLRDDSSAGGYALRALATNLVSSYA